MPITIGTERISGMQRQYLSRARDLTIPGSSDEWLHLFYTLANDDDITDGRENLHPEWISLYAKIRPTVAEAAPSTVLTKLDDIFRAATIDPGIELIDPKASHLCFLLGAGASKPVPSGIPTVKELLPDLLNRARRLDRDEVTRLAKFCDDSRIDNIEDLLTAAQLSEFCGRNPTVMRLVEFLLFREDLPDRPPSRRRSLVDASSVALLQDTLQVLFGLLSSRMLPAEPNQGHKAIANYVSSNTNAPVITTNYDCCIDRALTELDVNYSYGIEFRNPEPTPTSDRPPMSLVKLHGSLNWFYCEACQEVHLIDIVETVRDYIADKVIYPVIGVCRNCGGQRRGLLVPPLAMKFDVAPPLNPLIDRASACFDSGDAIVVVGFSFADADLYISRMISKAMQARENLKLLVFDPDRSVVDKVRRKFSVRIPDFDSSRILAVPGDCAETLPKFLAGEYKKKERTVAAGENAPNMAAATLS